MPLANDAANAAWGGNWRMPTVTEWNELKSQCNWTWTTISGKSGYKVSSKTRDTYIFLVASESSNTAGKYWSSSKDGSYPSLMFFVQGSYVVTTSAPYLGCRVRPVLSE